MADTVLRFLLAAGHGLGNSTAGKFDPGAVSPLGQEHAIVAQLVEDVVYDTSFTKNGGPMVADVPQCSDWCAARHPKKADLTPISHLSFVVSWLNRHSTPFDYVLSLHMNSAASAEASGVEVYYAKAAGATRRKQAEAVARIVATALGLPNRGAYKSSESQHSSLAILDRTNAPALLIELGFVTNPTDVANVKQCGKEAIQAAMTVIRNFK